MSNNEYPTQYSEELLAEKRALVQLAFHRGIISCAILIAIPVIAIILSSDYFLLFVIPVIGYSLACFIYIVSNRTYAKQDHVIQKYFSRSALILSYGIVGYLVCLYIVLTIIVWTNYDGS